MLKLITLILLDIIQFMSYNRLKFRLEESREGLYLKMDLKFITYSFMIDYDNN